MVMLDKVTDAHTPQAFQSFGEKMGKREERGERAIPLTKSLERFRKDRTHSKINLDGGGGGGGGGVGASKTRSRIVGDVWGVSLKRGEEGQQAGSRTYTHHKKKWEH